MLEHSVSQTTISEALPQRTPSLVRKNKVHLFTTHERQVGPVAQLVRALGS